MASKQTICTRGHDMSETRRYHPNGDSYCKECKRIRTKQAIKDNPKRAALYSRRTNLRRFYGLEEFEYNELFDKQNGQCAICEKDLERISRSTHVDHNHTTGDVRGILCHHCNTAIGLLKDNTEIMLKAIQYLSEAGKSKKKK